MAASKKTAEDVLAVLRAHCDEAQVSAILNDLLQVKGNRSFTETVQRLTALHWGESEEEQIARARQSHRGY